MDIAKYVGLFLVKNEYCFLPGIGSLQVEKKPAEYSKETQTMNAPAYEVRFRAVGGSIDDSFANFIANNERISIAHASNHLKDFCARAKAELKEGREVVIPAIGKFVAAANGVIQFVTDPHLHIEGRSIPFFKNSTVVEQKKEEAISNIIERTNIREPKADEEIEYKAPSVNWGKIILLAAILIIILGGIASLLWYLNRSPGGQPAATVDTAGIEESVVEPTVVPAVDSAAATQPVQLDAAASGLQQNADGTVSYKVLLQEYTTEEKATGRVNKLISYGNAGVSMMAQDSARYLVVMSITSAPVDTGRVVDSLRRVFNPAGRVTIVR